MTIALLDTGVDSAHPYLRGRILPGVDLVDDMNSGAPAVADPDDATRLEEHGTEMAGLLVGAGGPGGISGVATGASVLPIRVAGWQRDLTGGWAVYGRTDQLIAGLERAVDPNVDGDAHDAARIALIGLAASYAAFADSPEAQAIRGALRLDTLVVAPAGNDGPAGPGYGSIASPGGAPAALTVGAADLRTEAEEAPVVVRTGLRLLLDERMPLAGAVVATKPLELELAEPRPTASPSELSSFFDGKGVSLVAGKAAFVKAGGDPRLTIEHAVAAGARAVVVYGTELPAGGLGLDEAVDVPVLSVPTRVGRIAADAARQARPRDRLDRRAEHGPQRIGRRDRAVLVARPRLRRAREARRGGSRSRARDLGARARTTTAPPRYGTVNGSSASAAVVAGAAALLAEVRPDLRAADVKSLLTGTARPLPDESVTAQGAGLVDVGGAAAAELAALPATLAFGRVQGDGWHATQLLTLHDVSTRKLRVRIEAGGRDGLQITPFPRRVRLKPDGSTVVRLVARLRGAPPAGGSAEGAILLKPRGSAQIRVPWAITFGRPPGNLLSAVALSALAFRPSDTNPAVLSLRAGSLVQDPTGPQIRPVARLDVELWHGGERIGLLARLRDLLPGRIAIGLTGRDPEGNLLAPGPYRIRLIAVPTTGGTPTVKRIAFRIKQ